MNSALAIIFSVAIFLALITSMAVKPDSTKSIIRGSMLISACVGVILYALGYTSAVNNIGEVPTAILRAVTSTLFMFAGKDNFNFLIGNWSYFQESNILQFLFWTVHMLAIYVSTTTVLTSIGQKLIRKLSYIRFRFGKKLLVVYGNDDEVYDIGKKLNKSFQVLFIGDKAPDFEKKTDTIGALAYTPKDLDKHGMWLKKLGIPTKKRIEVICLGNDDLDTIDFLEILIKGCKKLNVKTNQIHFSIICDNEYMFSFLHDTQNNNYQLEDEKYLLADIYTKSSLAARKVIQYASLWEDLQFGNGLIVGEERKLEHAALIIGFGDVGQQVLSSFVRNSQFVGCKEKIVVVDNNIKECGGIYCESYANMLKAYDIEFEAINLYSEQFITLLKKLSKNLKRVIVCTGDTKQNNEAINIVRTFMQSNNVNKSNEMKLVIVDKKEVCVSTFPYEANNISDRKQYYKEPILEPEELVHSDIDKKEFLVNKIYCIKDAKLAYPENQKLQEEYCINEWYKADIISRKSSRATADFMEAYRYILGAKNWNEFLDLISNNADLLDVVARTEHLRWNAFELSIGVHEMPIEKYRNSIVLAEEEYKRIEYQISKLESNISNINEETIQEIKQISSKFNKIYNCVRKNIPSYGIGGEHICLTDWASLDERWDEYKELEYHKKLLDYHVNKIEYLVLEGDRKKTVKCNTLKAPEKPTFKSCTDFKQLDRNNVIELAKMMAKEEKRENN